MFKSLVALAALGLSIGSANAGSIFDPINIENPEAWSLAVNGHHGAGLEFNRMTLEQTAQRAIDALIGQAIKNLRAAGNTADADRIEREWQGTYSLYFNGTGIDLLNVGDFRPLNAWFADTYKHLLDRYGTRLNMIRILDDLNTINYTLLVVFQPKGDRRTGDTWDMREYRMHFVPFSGVVTYWGSWAACAVAFRENPDISKFCKRAANLLSRGMIQFVAPKLSDRVWLKANGQPLEAFDLDLDGAVDQYLNTLW